MIKRNVLNLLAIGACCTAIIACQFRPVLNVSGGTSDRVMRITDLRPGDSRLMPDLLGDKKFHHGGVYIFKPGETAHPEPRHVHKTDEVFIFIQGKGVLPIDGVDYPVKTGDVVISEVYYAECLRIQVQNLTIKNWKLS